MQDFLRFIFYIALFLTLLGSINVMSRNITAAAEDSPKGDFIQGLVECIGGGKSKQTIEATRGVKVACGVGALVVLLILIVGAFDKNLALFSCTATPGREFVHVIFMIALVVASIAALNQGTTNIFILSGGDDTKGNFIGIIASWFSATTKGKQITRAVMGSMGALVLVLMIVNAIPGAEFIECVPTSASSKPTSIF